MGLIHPFVFIFFNVLSESLNFVVGERLQFHDFKLIFGFTCYCSEGGKSHITKYSPNCEYIRCCYEEETRLIEVHLIWFTEKIKCMQLHNGYI